MVFRQDDTTIEHRAMALRGEFTNCLIQRLTGPVFFLILYLSGFVLLLSANVNC